jgi:phosphoesterase RecJ-like protein
MDHAALTAISALIDTPQRIAITTHQKPDGDAIGSSLALYHYLKGLGHNVKLVVPTDFPDFFKWLEGTKEVFIGPNDPDAAAWAFEGADVIFCLDFNALHRVLDLEKPVKESLATKVMMDHHLDPEDFCDHSYSDPKASSTAEIVYRFILARGHKDRITLPIANALYTGLVTDTGSFRFSSTTKAVHEMAGHLLEVGINPTNIHDQIFAQSSVDRLRFFGHCFSHCLTVLPEYETAYFKLEKQIFKDFNVKTGDTEGLVNYALGIKGVKLGVLISVQKDLVKLSFRSRGEVSAKAYAEQFNGGGHFYASGGRSTDTLEATESKFIGLLKTNYESQLDEKPQLT